MTAPLILLAALHATSTAFASAPASPSYRELSVPLKESVPVPFVALAVAGGDVWIATDDGGLHQIEALGGGMKTMELPTKGASVYAMWASETNLIVAVDDGSFYRVSNAGSVMPLVHVDPRAFPAVPVRGGWVGTFRRESTVFYVGDDGTRFPLSFAPPPPSSPRQEEPLAPESDAELLGDDAGFVVGSTTIPGPGSLVPMDEDHVLYVVDDPYSLWIVRLDGRSRRIDIDTSSVSEPGGPPWDFAILKTVERPQTLRAEMHEGRLAINRSYRTSLELVRNTSAGRTGETIETRSQIVDLVDLDSGRVVERLDLWRMKNPGWWAGFRGADLVFFAPGAVNQLTVMSRD